MQIAYPQINSVLQVLPGGRQEVMFRDGSRLELHRVQALTAQIPDPHLRATYAGAQCVLFDLRHVTPPDFEADFKRLEQRDHAGMVFYSLRQAHRSAAAALHAIHAQALARTAVAQHQAPAPLAA